MAGKRGNPNINEVNKGTQWKDGESGNYNGRPKRFAFEDMFCEEFKHLADAKVPHGQIVKVRESLDAMTYDELMATIKNKGMPLSVRTLAKHKVKAWGKNGTVKDTQMLDDLTKPKDAQANGSELPPVPIVNLNIYAEKAKETE